MRRLAMLTAIALATRGAPSQADLITNGGFEAPDFGGPFLTYGPGSTALTGWVVDGAGIVHVGTFWQHAAGAHSVELNFFAAGGISQTVATAAGQAYLLEFDMAGQTNAGPAVKQMQVFWDGALVSTQGFNVTGHTLASMGWEHRALLLPAASGASTVLRFFGSAPAAGDGGPALDNVTLNLAPVPEPGSAALLGAGALGLIGSRMRRRRSNRA